MEFTKSNAFSSNLKGYIQPGDDNNCPVLYLKDTNGDSGISLKLFRNQFIQAINSTKKIESTICGESRIGFYRTLDFSGALYEPTKLEIDSITDLLIFGHICESVCKAEFPIQKIMSNIHLFRRVCKHIIIVLWRL